MKIIVVLLFMLPIFSAKAAMWTAQKSWDEAWQIRYSEWVANSVGPNFFKDLGGTYARLKLDCADAEYALKAYFSYLHKLDFAANGGRITHETTRFDHIKNINEKMAAFINHLSANLGTESLSHQDSYPVAIKNVRPGDLFMYKVGSNGNFTRHTYIIKNINIDGTFDVMYSTQARRDKGLPLTRQTTYMFTKAPLNKGVDRNYWGFRRMKTPKNIHIAQDNLRASDFSQYVLAERTGQLDFFRQVKRIHQSVSESPNMLTKRNFNTVCEAIKDRVDIVKNAVDYVKKVGGRCLSEQEYDAYSTPSRDSGIMDNYRNYEADLTEIHQAGKGANVDSKMWTASWGIFNDQHLTPNALQILGQLCSVTAGSAGDVNLAIFKRALFAHKVSYRPNDDHLLRWGKPSSQGKTRCPEYYGYPAN